MSFAAAMMSCGVMLLRVPISSSGPQRPQLSEAVSGGLDIVAGDFGACEIEQVLSSFRFPGVECPIRPRNHNIPGGDGRQLRAGSTERQPDENLWKMCITFWDLQGVHQKLQTTYMIHLIYKRYIRILVIPVQFRGPSVGEMLQDTIAAAKFGETDIGEGWDTSDAELKKHQAAGEGCAVITGGSNGIGAATRADAGEYQGRAGGGGI